jgi:hypothetical protein
VYREPYAAPGEREIRELIFGYDLQDAGARQRAARNQEIMLVDVITDDLLKLSDVYDMVHWNEFKRNGSRLQDIDG